MRLTRRSLLGILGMGAAAAALAPGKPVEAAEAACTDCLRVFAPAVLPYWFERITPAEGNVIQRSVHARALRLGESHEEAFDANCGPTTGLLKRAYADGRAQERTEALTAAAATTTCHQCQPDSPFPHVYGHPEAAPVMPTLPDGQVWVLSSEVAQARADGYNRGRDAEAARQESKLSQRLHPVHVDDWSDGEARAYSAPPGSYRWVRSGDSEPRRIWWTTEA